MQSTFLSNAGKPVEVQTFELTQYPFVMEKLILGKHFNARIREQV